MVTSGDQTLTYARDRLVDCGLDLFYKQGFHATALDQILEAAEVSKTTFYKHFESKDELALVCITRRDESWRERFPKLLLERAGADPIDRLREVFALWQEWFDNIHFNGCLFIHACSEFPNRNDPCHAAAAGSVNAIRDVIAGLAEEAGFGDPDGFAERYKLLMQGAVVVEIIDRDGDAARTAASVASVLIEQELSRARRRGLSA